MQLKETLFQLQQIVEIFHVGVTHQTIRGVTYTDLSNLYNVRSALELLKPTQLFDDKIAELEQTGIFHVVADQARFDQQQAIDMVKIINQVKTQMLQVITLLKKVVRPVDENAVVITLPGRDLAELAKQVHAFDKIISQVIINKEIEGQVQIQNVENGSVLIEIAVGTVAAVNIIAKLANAAAVIMHQRRLNAVTYQNVENLKMSREMIKELGEKLDQEVNTQIAAEAAHIHSQYFATDNKAMLSTLTHSIDLLSDQLNKGALIQATMAAPQETKTLFKDVKHLVSIASDIKQIRAES